MKLKRHESTNSFGLRSNDFSIQLSVVGEATSFYLYRCKHPESGSDSTKFISDISVYHSLKKALSGSQSEFEALFDQIFEDNKK